MTIQEKNKTLLIKIMAQGTRPEYRETLKRVAASIGANYLLSINDIGVKNSKVSLDTILSCMVYTGNKFEGADYKAHYGEDSRLADFIEIGLPEYTIERLIRRGYVEQRAKQITRSSDEELLQASLNSLTSKYGKTKVTKLKKRLGIKDIRYH